MTDEPPFRILALDGGGLRGAYAAAALARIEKTTGKPTHEFFDLITGTSTGGILAVGLGLGKPAADLLAFYKKHGPRIFPRLRPAAAMATGAKHKPGPLRKALQEVLGDQRLGDAHTRLCIPAHDATNLKPRVFKTSHHEGLHIDCKLEAWRVALATSAAPFYLPGARVEPDADDVLVDGGLWANNPAMVGVLEAFTYLEQDLENVAVLSIGTGMGRPVSKKAALKPGPTTWVPQIFDAVTSGQTNAVDFQLNLLRRRGLTYHRMQPEHGNGAKLDDPRKISDFAGYGDADARHRIAELEPVFFAAPRAAFVPVHAAGSDK